VRLVVHLPVVLNPRGVLGLFRGDVEVPKPCWNERGDRGQGAKVPRPKGRSTPETDSGCLTVLDRLHVERAHRCDGQYRTLL